MRLVNAIFEYVILAGSLICHCEAAVCLESHFSRKNGVQSVGTRQRKGPLRGSASRPARPKRLKAGAAKSLT